jgi:hypothetical protein
MKKIAFAVAAALSLTFAQTPATAGPAGKGHSHDPINAEAAGKRGMHIVAVLVKRKIVPASWLKMKPASIEETKRRSRREWKVTFKNPEIKNPKKQTLYVFLSITGHYKAANYSGH